MKKNGTNPTPRKKAGWSVKDRVCALCGEWIPVDKYLNEHHLSYGDTKESRKRNIGHPPRQQDKKVSLHYNCHNYPHARIKYHNAYEKRYGKDFGAVAMALDIIKLYRPVLKEALKYIRKIKGE